MYTSKERRLYVGNYYTRFVSMVYGGDLASLSGEEEGVWLPAVLIDFVGDFVAVCLNYRVSTRG